MADTTTLRPDLQAVLASVNERFDPSRAARSDAERASRLRALAETQTRMGFAYIRDLRNRRRWLRDCAKLNPGVSRFYPAGAPGEVDRVLGIVAGCRRAAAKARAEARALEAAAAGRRAA